MNDPLVGEIKKKFIDIYYISVSSREQDEANPLFWLATRKGKMSHLASSLNNAYIYFSLTYLLPEKGPVLLFRQRTAPSPSWGSPFCFLGSLV